MRNSNVLFLMFIFLSVFSCQKENLDFLNTPDFEDHSYIVSGSTYVNETIRSEKIIFLKIC